MSDIEALNYSTVTRVTGSDEAFAADVSKPYTKAMLEVHAVELASQFKTSAVTVTTTATNLTPTPLANRTEILIQNNGKKPIYVGSSTVTTSTGLVVQSGGSLALKLINTQVLYAIGTESTNVRVGEFA